MLYTKQGQWSRSYFHEQYMDISQNPNFQLSISVKHNENPFEQLGSALACRQNQSVVAQVMRLIARVMTN